ncbi:zinc dependent phospholipase C family protein [Lachnospiraceae bacterium 45-W7]
MPGFTTHYLFGVNAFQQLEHNALKQAIHSQRAAYSLGLQGPDIFFYFLPAIYTNNIGSIAHTERTGRFLQHLLESRKLFHNKKEQQIAAAYTAGFLGHYILDTRCHPYVYWKSNFSQKNSRYHGCHMELEAAIDTKLLQLYKHCPPSAFRQNSTIPLTCTQLRTVSSMLYYACRKTYPKSGVLYAVIYASIRSMQIGTRWLHDPSGKKKNYLCKLEQIILGYPLLSALIPGDTQTVHMDPLNILKTPWRNPWQQSRIFTDSFLELMEQAQNDYLKILNLFNSLPAFTCVRSKQQTQFLLEKLGNNSYHSGLDCRIPS